MTIPVRNGMIGSYLYYQTLQSLLPECELRKYRGVPYEISIYKQNRRQEHMGSNEGELPVNSRGYGAWGGAAGVVYVLAGWSNPQ